MNNGIEQKKQPTKMVSCFFITLINISYRPEFPNVMPPGFTVVSTLTVGPKGLGCTGCVGCVG